MANKKAHPNSLRALDIGRQPCSINCICKKHHGEPKNVPGTISLAELTESIEDWSDEEINTFSDESGAITFFTCKTCNRILIDQRRQHCSRACSTKGGVFKNNNGTKAFRKWWDSLSPEEKHTHQSKASKASNAVRWSSPRAKKDAQKASDNMVEMHRSGKLKGGYSRGKKGTRKDLGLYVRSSWEANIARYLNYLMEQGKVVHWEYESHRFEFKQIKRGTRSYLPDFCVVLKSGNLEWWEVKGWWTAKAKTAVKRFRKYYPDEKLVIIDKEIYKKIEQEFGLQIPEWE